MSALTFTVSNLSKPTRLDKMLRNTHPEWGRKAVNQLIKDRQVSVNDKIVWLNSWKVKNGDQISLDRVPDALPQAPTSFDPKWLIVDDGEVIAINKPVGLLSQETKYKKGEDLLYLVTQAFGEVNLFHRLDRDTSGVILFTRGGDINAYLDHAFQNQLIEKEYIAVVAGDNRLNDEGVITVGLDQHPKHRNKMIPVPHGGKSAETHYQIEKKLKNGTQLVRLQPITGRTHQLRVHMEYLKAPILGDRLYSRYHKQFYRLFLHAHRIVLPASENYPRREFMAPIPSEFYD